MTGYCKYCDTQTDDIIEARDSDTHRLIWVGCLGCYRKRIGMMKNATVAKQV